MNTEKENKIVKEIVSIPIDKWEFVDDKVIAETRGMKVEFISKANPSGNNFFVSIDGIEMGDDFEQSLRKLSHRIFERKVQVRNDDRNKKVDEVYNKFFPQ